MARTQSTVCCRRCRWVSWQPNIAPDKRLHDGRSCEYTAHVRRSCSRGHVAKMAIQYCCSHWASSSQDPRCLHFATCSDSCPSICTVSFNKNPRQVLGLLAGMLFQMAKRKGCARQFHPLHLMGGTDSALSSVPPATETMSIMGPGDRNYGSDVTG